MRQTAAIVILICSTALLSACSTENLAFGLAPEDAIGNWVSTDPSVELQLSADGSLTASNWPTNFYCSGAPAQDLDDLREAERVDLEGEWLSDEGELSHHMTLLFSSATCPIGGTSVGVWRDTDDSLYMCLYIPPDLDPDVATDDERFILQKGGGEEGDATGACGS